LGGELTVTLVHDVGQGFEVHDMDMPLVIRAITELRQRHVARAGSVVRARVS
jgi:hypothetical protein